MKLIVGLGNPGSRYERTLHNIGFAVVDEIAARMQSGWRTMARFNAVVARGDCCGQDIMLAKPQTFMNASGTAVGALLRYRKLEPADLVVVFDDADLEIGRLRVRPSGGTGGHRGLASVIEHVGSAAFARVRVGIGRGCAADLVGHVLHALPLEMWCERVGPAAARAADAALCVLENGVNVAMNGFNGPVPDGDDKSS